MNDAPQQGQVAPAVVVLTGSGLARGDAQVGEAVLPWLVSRKSRKFMGKQDMLAVIAAGHALAASGWGEALCAEAGVYLTVGHIPFERGDIEAIAQHSRAADGRFDVQRFAREGIEQVNPLLTFRCLPNMPAYHLSVNFGMRGSYFISYPGAAQFQQALEQAVHDLRSGRVRQALVGAVADQDNFLVDFHLARTPGRAAHPPIDAAACLCLELEATAHARGARVWARLAALEIAYDPAAKAAGDALACTDLPAALHDAVVGRGLPWQHGAATADHCRITSRWEA